MLKLTLILGILLFLLTILGIYCVLAIKVFKVEAEKAGIILMTLYNILIAYMFVDSYLMK